jgi:hypothetical protein
LSGKRFSPDELATMTDACARGGLDAACAALPHRRRGAIYKRLERLGMLRPVRRRAWTMDDRRYLRTHWATTSARTIAEDLGRTENAVNVMATKLHLPRKRNRLWMPGAVRVIERATDQLVSHLIARTGRSPAAVRHQVMTALVGYGKRRRAEAITDLGGMAPHAGSRREVA